MQTVENGGDGTEDLQLPDTRISENRKRGKKNRGKAMNSYKQDKFMDCGVNYDECDNKVDQILQTEATRFRRRRK